MGKYVSKTKGQHKKSKEKTVQVDKKKSKKNDQTTHMANKYKVINLILWSCNERNKNFGAHFIL